MYNSFATLWTVALQAPLFSGFWGKNTGVGCHFLLQGLFLTQGSNPRLLHWQADSLPLSHVENPVLLLPMLNFSPYYLSLFTTMHRLKGGALLKNLPAMHNNKHEFNPWVGKILWRRKWKLTPVFSPGKFHGQRSLVSCSPWCHKALDTTEHTSIMHTDVYLPNYLDSQLEYKILFYQCDIPSS